MVTKETINSIIVVRYGVRRIEKNQIIRLNSIFVSCKVTNFDFCFSQFHTSGSNAIHVIHPSFTRTVRNTIMTGAIYPIKTIIRSLVQIDKPGRIFWRVVIGYFSSYAIVGFFRVWHFFKKADYGFGAVSDLDICVD